MLQPLKQDEFTYAQRPFIRIPAAASLGHSHFHSARRAVCRPYPVHSTSFSVTELDFLFRPFPSSYGIAQASLVGVDLGPGLEHQFLPSEVHTCALGFYTICIHAQYVPKVNGSTRVHHPSLHLRSFDLLPDLLSIDRSFYFHRVSFLSIPTFPAPAYGNFTSLFPSACYSLQWHPTK
jgi:hypothetical protein